MPYIQFLGAAGTVTGSKHLVNVDHNDGDDGSGLQFLIDCGLFQGPKEWRELPFAARELEAVILTHAHLDHSGWLPRLVRSGFRGAIYATAPTVDLCSILLPDSGHLQEEDAAFHNRHKTSKHKPALPLYTFAEAQQVQQYFQTVAFGEVKQLRPGVSFQFFHAAHILGSSMVRLTLDVEGRTRTLIFTGDIGRVRDSAIAPGKVVHSGPDAMPECDVLVMESTYGNREHPTTDARPELARLIRATVERGGCVVVPAFAVERTQKLLFMLKDMMEAGEIPRIPVHADSPMAIQAVNIFLKYSDEFSDDARRLIGKFGSPLTWPGCVLHHLAQRLPDPRNLVLFIGFQAQGTRGALLKQGVKAVRIFGDEVPVRAQIAALEQFSDHADTRELLEWLRTFPRAPGVAYLVHGEPASAAKLRESIMSALGWRVEVAQWMEKVEV